MPPQLVALTEGPDLLLDKPILLVGRHQECDVLIPSRKISRRHCLIAQVNEYLVVRDLFSTNGIRVNGIRVKEGKLHAGDELTIAHFRYEVRFNGTPDAPVGPGTGAAAKPALPALVAEEDAFASCELPVALSEPPGSVKPPAGSAPLLPKNISSWPPPQDDPNAPPPLQDKPSEIPEDLNLKPLSDSNAPKP